MTGDTHGAAINGTIAAVSGIFAGGEAAGWLVTFLIAALLVVVATPVAMRLAWRWGFVDRPAQHKAHAAPTPMLGGVAVVVAVVAATMLSARAGVQSAEAFRPALLAGVVLCGLGAWDDRRPLPVSLRLVCQVIVMSTLVLATDVGTGLSPLLLLVSVGWLLLVTNALNLLDNVDGVASAVTAVAALGFVALGGGAEAAALAGAGLAFLGFNRPTARVFLGDAGSLPMGLWLGVLGLEFAVTEPSSWAFVVPALVLSVPLFDTVFVSLSRLRRGLNPLTTPGLDHVAHRLGRLGLGRWWVLAIMTGGAGLGVLAAVAVHRVGPRSTTATLIVAVGLLAAGLLAVGLALMRERPRPLGVAVAQRPGKSPR